MSFSKLLRVNRSGRGYVCASVSGTTISVCLCIDQSFKIAYDEAREAAHRGDITREDEKARYTEADAAWMAEMNRLEVSAIEQAKTEYRATQGKFTGRLDGHSWPLYAWPSSVPRELGGLTCRCYRPGDHTHGNTCIATCPHAA